MESSIRICLGLTGLFLSAPALNCGGGGANPYSLGVGGDDGGPSFPSSEVDGGQGALDAYIEQNEVAVKFVTLNCSGDCATVEAVGTGGHPPYTFKWDDGATNVVRNVCPSSTTHYSVTVADTGQVGEFPRPSATAQAGVTAEVLSCPDGGSGDAGACAPGSYIGTFIGTGPVDAGSSAATGGPVTVPLTLPLVRASDGGTGLTTAGPLVLNWDIAADWTPDFTGGLDCTTGSFRVEDPKTPETVAGVSTGTCDMTWVGTLDRSSETLTGTWTAACPAVVWGGSWSATLMQ